MSNITDAMESPIDVPLHSSSASQRVRRAPLTDQMTPTSRERKELQNAVNKAVAKADRAVTSAKNKVT